MHACMHLQVQMLIKAMIWNNTCDQSKCPASNWLLAYDLSKHMPSSPTPAISCVQIESNHPKGVHKAWLYC